jgi:hypothetical protein
MLSTNDTASMQAHLLKSRLGLAWATFFLIAFGLGYPTLNRYDARNADPDVIHYYKMVLSEPATPDDLPFCVRVLVPGVARPFYHLGIDRVGSWSPVYFGLLVSTSMFTATAALFLLLIGIRLDFGVPCAWLGCTIFLLNFVVSNYWLSGLVDSGEGCLLLVVAWCLFANRWWPLPLLGILCAMAKQSTLPFALIFATVWWLTLPRPRRTVSQIASIAAMAMTGITTLVLVYRVVEGGYLPPWTMAGWYNQGSYLDNIKGLLVEGRFWYAFVWLVPLGVWRLNRLPRQWVMASLVTTLFALFMAVLSHLGGTVNRAVFNVMGPILSISTALFLASQRDQANGPSDQEMRPR